MAANIRTMKRRVLELLKESTHWTHRENYEDARAHAAMASEMLRQLETMTMTIEGK